MNLKNGKVFTSKFVGTGPLSYKKKNLPGHGLTKVEKHWSRGTKYIHCANDFVFPKFTILKVACKECDVGSFPKCRHLLNNPQLSSEHTCTPS